MKPLAALTLLLSLVAFAAAQEPKKELTGPEILRQFQGTWTVEGWEEGGKALSENDLKARGVFFGANVLVFRRDDKPFRAGGIQFDPTKSPATINYIVREGDAKGEVLSGIYALDGDSLKLCFNPKGDERPKEFASDAQNGFTLITLKKPKPPANEAIDVVGKYRSRLVDAKTGKVDVADVFIEKRGDGYTMTYKLEDKVLFVGTALRKGDQLSACWASGMQVGVSVYKIETGPKLTGEFTILGGIGVTGKETLTRAQPRRTVRSRRPCRMRQPAE